MAGCCLHGHKDGLGVGTHTGLEPPGSDHQSVAWDKLQLGVEKGVCRHPIRELNVCTRQIACCDTPAACSPEKAESKGIPGRHMALHGISLKLLPLQVLEQGGQLSLGKGLGAIALETLLS